MKLCYRPLLGSCFLLVILFLGMPQALAQSQKDEDLLNAIKTNKVSIAKELLSNGADVNAKDEKGVPALMWAAYKTNLAFVRFMISEGADYKLKGALYFEAHSFYGNLTGIAAGENNVEMLKYFVDNLGIDINDQEYNPADNEDSGWTALDWALNKRARSTIDFLLNNGALVRKESYNALSKQIQSGNYEHGLSLLNKLDDQAKTQPDFKEKLEQYSILWSIYLNAKSQNVVNAFDQLVELKGGVSSSDGDLYSLYRSALRAIDDLSKTSPDSVIIYQSRYLEKVQMDSTNVKDVVQMLKSIQAAWYKIGAFEKWEELNSDFQKRVEKEKTPVFALFHLAYVNLNILDENSEDHLRAVLNNTNSDNYYLSEAAFSLLSRKTKVSVEDSLLQYLQDFKLSNPVAGDHHHFLTYYYHIRILQTELLMKQRKMDQAFERLTLTFEDYFNSIIRKSTMNQSPMINEEAFGVMAGSFGNGPMDSKKAVVYHLLGNDLEMPTSLSNQDLDATVDQLYRRLKSNLKKKQVAILALEYNNYDSFMPACVLYVITTEFDEPIVLPVPNYSNLSYITRNNDRFDQELLYLGFWSHLEKVLPNRTKKILFKPSNFFKANMVGKMINPKSSRSVSQEYKLEYIVSLEKLINQ